MTVEKHRKPTRKERAEAEIDCRIADLALNLYDLSFIRAETLKKFMVAAYKQSQSDALLDADPASFFQELGYKPTSAKYHPLPKWYKEDGYEPTDDEIIESIEETGMSTLDGEYADMADALVWLRYAYSKARIDIFLNSES